MRKKKERERAKVKNIPCPSYQKKKKEHTMSKTVKKMRLKSRMTF